jgi:cytoskeletal protein CcmA (bactofilin family)
MFGSKKNTDTNNHTLISRGTKVVGDIHFVGELQIEGQIIGNVIAEGGNDASLVIHEKGKVEGEIRVPRAIINGNVVGDVRSSAHIELANKAVIQGDVYYSIIEMVKGSQVNGNLVHSNEKNETSKKIESALKTKAMPMPAQP